MKNATQKRTKAEEGEALVPASGHLPKDVYEKIEAEAKRNERSFAQQYRLIAKEWAAKKAN